MEPNPVYKDANGEAVGVTPPAEEDETLRKFNEEVDARILARSQHLAPKPKVVTREDAQAVEILALRSELLLRRREDLMRQLNEVTEALVKNRDAVRVKQEELSHKYDVDFSKEQVDVNTGRIVPAFKT